MSVHGPGRGLRLLQGLVLLALAVACGETAHHVWGDLSVDHLLLGIAHTIATISAATGLIATEHASLAIVIVMAGAVALAIHALGEVGRTRPETLVPGTPPDRLAAPRSMPPPGTSQLLPSRRGPPPPAPLPFLLTP
jgi:hypothetical protein